MSSMSSAGRGLCVCSRDLESRFVELEGEDRSRLLRAVRRRYDFEARVRAVLSACDR